MILWNFIILKLFLVLTFFNCYVYARYPFVSTEFILYEGSNRFPTICGSFTWIPLTPLKDNCQRTWNSFRDSVNVKAIQEGNVKICQLALSNASGRYDFRGNFEKDTLHDFSMLCANLTVCQDLEAEVDLNLVWERIKSPTTTRDDCSKTYDSKNIFQSSCPFSSRVDLQHYIFHNEEKHRTKTNLNESELCEDQYGRKYPPPEGLGGKCVMFQHEFVEDGERKTELFMPIEKRDLVERIAQYPNDHEIRKNKDTLNRLLPKEINADINPSCRTLHYQTEAFVHCIYYPKDSKIFHPSESNSYFCPKNKNISGTWFVQGNLDLVRESEEKAVYNNFKIDKKLFVFSEDCYISNKFTPHNSPNGINVTLDINILGEQESFCSQNPIVETGKSLDEYETALNKSKERFCPWENGTTFSICFKAKSAQLYSSYLESMTRIINATVFQPCYYQVNSNGCYYQVDLLNGTRSRVPSAWVSLIESGTVKATKKNYGDEAGCGIVYISSEMKNECSNKALKQGIEYSKMGSNEIICKCTEDLCDDPNGTNPTNLDKYLNDVVCNQGATETSSPSPFFFCSVRLTTKAEDGKKVKLFTYSYIDPNNAYKIDPVTCWNHTTWTKKLIDPEVSETDFSSTCFHDHETQIYECCCYASNTPCNTHKIIEAYFEIANQAAKENENRLRVGCDFKAHISASGTKDTCDKDTVRHDREMRCYGVFKVPSTDHGTVKPELIKENCYYPHPQYHDEYSIFCSNAFFEIDDLVDEKCVSLFINDYTSAAEKKLDQTLILCCNTGVYPEKRELILSRSFIVL